MGRKANLLVFLTYSAALRVVEALTFWRRRAAEQHSLLERYYVALQAFAELRQRGWWGTSRGLYNGNVVVRLYFQSGSIERHRRVYFAVTAPARETPILVSAVQDAAANAILIERAATMLGRRTT